MENLYRLLDVFFLVFHTGLILFNLFGWIWKRTRRWNLATLLLTGASWGLLGIWYGFGYCPCTDWHWQVRRALGYHDMPASYIKFLLRYFTGISFPSGLVDAATLFFFLLALGASLYVNLRRPQPAE